MTQRFEQNLGQRRLDWQKTGLLLGLAYGLTALPAAGQESSMPALSWEAPAGCPQLDEVQARTRAIAGASVRRENQLEAHGEITKAEGRFHLKLVVPDGKLVGQRNISSDSCQDLAGAAAVALGLLLRSETPLTQSELGGAKKPSAPADTAQPPASTAPTAPAPAAPTAKLSAERRWRALLRLPVLVAEVGPLPDSSLGLSLGVGVGYEKWRALVGGQLWLNQTVHGTDLPQFGADVSRQTTTLSIGRGFGRGRWELGPSLTLALERITASGTGPNVTPSKQHALWLGVGADVEGVLYVFESLALFGGLGGRIETSRPVIAIDGLGDVRQLRSLALHTAIGVECRF